MTLAATVTASGISAPTYSDVLSSLQASYQSIYGSDVYLGPDSQDGQFLAILAQAISDVNAAAIAVYNAFSPATAQGAGLSSVVKINGIVRQAATNSQATVTLVGQAGTTILNGVVADTGKNKWNLPPAVTIPVGGSINVLATAQVAGAIAAAPGTITTISTPTLGWQSVTNAAAAAIGVAVETDAQLRVRQSISTALPSLSVLEGITGAVANLPGVLQVKSYENDTSSVDANGVPDHSISLVVEGGDPVAIATTIAKKKTPGTGTYGNTTETILDANGVPSIISFFTPIQVPIVVSLSIKALPGYLSSTGTALVNAIVEYVNSVPIGGGNATGVEVDAMFQAIKSIPFSDTFRTLVITIRLGRTGVATGGSAYNLVDTTKSWPADMWAPVAGRHDYFLLFTTGLNVGSIIPILSNTGTQLNFGQLVHAVQAGDQYEISGQDINPDMPLAFNELPTCLAASVALTVT